MSVTCPISGHLVNERVARVTAGVILGLVALSFFHPLQWIIFGLAGDFFIRAFLKQKFSPLVILSKGVLAVLHVEPKMVDAGPKIFAAKIGFVCCVSIAVLYMFQLNYGAYTVSAMIILFALLESAFAYCVGCKIYSFLISIKIIKRN